MFDNIYYVHDEELVSECDRIPAVCSRASMVHSLIKSYLLTERMKAVVSTKATADELNLFHSADFIKYIQNANDLDLDDVDEEQLEYGFCYDCPPIKNLYNTILTIAGGSSTAAEKLMEDGTNVAINWNGGWHHAQRDEAEGFCYVNDIVIAIEKLRKKFDRILYVDLDIHHGNGVENAYLYTKRVFTLSFHKYEPGFYPGTGGIEDIGIGNGKGYSCNVPFRQGVSDDSMCYAFDQICPEVYNAYKPEAIVVQCGGDCLNGDPLGQSNLTPLSIGKCVETLMSWGKPLLFLGGGGYHFANTAKLWTYLTAVITNQKENLSPDIPDEDEFFLKYGPDYRLEVTKGNQKDMNDRDYLESLVEMAKENIKTYIKR